MVKATIRMDSGDVKDISGEIIFALGITDEDKKAKLDTALMGTGRPLVIVTAVAHELVRFAANNASEMARMRGVSESMARHIIHLAIMDAIKDAVAESEGIDLDDDDADEDEDEEDTADEVYETAAPKPGAKKFHRGRRV